MSAWRMALLIPLAALATLSADAATMTAEDLVARNLEARGGAEKLKAITSMHTVGTVRGGGGQEFKTESWAVAGRGFRSEFSLQGMIGISAWDGAQAWAIRPFGGRKEPQKLSPEDAKDLIERTDIAGPLVDHAAKGNTIDYLGTEDIDGTDAHKLRVTLKNGDFEYVYLDPDHFLEIRVSYHRMVRGQEQVSAVDFGEYQKVDGIYFPFEIGRNHIEKVELNIPIDAQRFAFPDAGRR